VSGPKHWKSGKWQLRVGRRGKTLAERVIGSIRRECLDHIVVIGERHLRRILSQYVAYYNRTRTHFPLSKDPPEHRTVQRPNEGTVIELLRVGGLHHEYVRRAV